MADSEDSEVVIEQNNAYSENRNAKPTPRVKKKWSNSDIEKLIEEYEAITYLWDTFSADYHNIEETSKRRKNCWYELLYQINILFHYTYILFDRSFTPQEHGN